MNDNFKNLKLLITNQIQYDAFRAEFVQQLNKVNDWLYVDANIDSLKLWFDVDGTMQLLDEYRIVMLDRYGEYSTKYIVFTVNEFEGSTYYWSDIGWFTDMLKNATRSIKIDLLLV